MVFLDGILTLLGLCGLCLFFAEYFDIRASLLPLPVLAGSAVWLCLCGFAGALLPGAWIWLALAAAGFVMAARHAGGVQKTLRRLWEPGFMMFFGGALLLWVLFAVTNPRFILWDEFTFWGSACKMTKVNHMLHPAAPGNVAARAGMPGLMLLAYLFQFSSHGFAEWKCFAAYDILYLAAFVTITASVQAAKGQERRWPRAVLLMAGAVLLPYFFQAPGPGKISTVYLNVMGDAALGLVFGGALCLYFLMGHTKKGFFALLPTLCFLNIIKDIGMAYAMIVIALAAADRWLAADHPGLKSFGRAVGGAVLLAIPHGSRIACDIRYQIKHCDVFSFWSAGLPRRVERRGK